MDGITEFTDFELTTKQQYGEALFATTVAFGASLAAKKVFTEAVKAIRNHKASK
jgi:hypothetical protein